MPQHVDQAEDGGAADDPGAEHVVAGFHVGANLFGDFASCGSGLQRRCASQLAIDPESNRERRGRFRRRAREQNAERKAFYQLAWHLGASQTDIALLTAADVNWQDRAIIFCRKKTGTRVIQFFDDETAAVLRTLPTDGPLFPYLRTVRAGDRATEFKQRCQGLNIKGVTLHCYRYAWAQRARLAGMPIRFAQEALGQNSKAVHLAYSDVPEVKVPTLSEYEKRRAMFADGKIDEPLPHAVNA